MTSTQSMADDITPIAATADIGSFIQRWEPADASERANYLLFLSELYGLLGDTKCQAFRGLPQC